MSTYSSILQACAAEKWLECLKFSSVAQQGRIRVFFDKGLRIGLDVFQYAMHLSNSSKMLILLYEVSKIDVKLFSGLEKFETASVVDLHQDDPPSLTWNKTFQFAFVWNSDFCLDTCLVSSVNIVFRLVEAEVWN